MFELQKIFLEKFGISELKSYFYFSGGTALSLFYYNHRESEDLDFFTDEKELLNLNKINFFFKSSGFKVLEYNKKYDRRIFIIEINKNLVKVEFTYYPFERIFPLKEIKGIMVDDKLDIITNKIAALCEREEEKDIFDIAFFIYKEGINSFKKVLDEYFDKKFGIPGCRYIVEKVLAGYEGEFESIKIINGHRKKEIVNNLKEALKKIVKEDIDESN